MRRPGSSFHRNLLVPLVSLLFVLSAAPVVSDHGQDLDGETVVFDHRGGNEWWVEVRVDHAGGPDEVHARAEPDDPWHPLTLRDWGNWAGSFHIEEGHQVQFRILDGENEVTSCWFGHPDGNEECAPVDGFDASFRTSGGNEWWIEVYVEANAPLSGVDARIDGGDWHGLQKRDWGAWAASLHVADGGLVEFQARGTNGETELSGSYRWPSGDEATPADDPDGPGDAPPEPAPMDASFRTPGGNEWWVEVYVETDVALEGVDARIDAGDWHGLQKRDWGAWAASLHVADGSLVEFRARGTNRETDVSGTYKWPSGDPVDPPSDPGDPEAFAATFHPSGGNAWWVEVEVEADLPLAGVDARAGGGAWQALQKKDWGAWAKSFHVPDGTLVQFRATSADGEKTSYSDSHRWPGQERVGPVPQWPEEGSHATYAVEQSAGSPGGYPRVDHDLNVTFTYREGAWEARCEGWADHYDENGEREIRERIDQTVALDPPRGPSSTGPIAGDSARIRHVDVDCTTPLLPGVLDGVTQKTYETKQDGHAVTGSGWYGTYQPEWPEWAAGHWEDKTGLVFTWDRAVRSGGSQGQLVDTDAPIAPDDPAPRPPPREAWPFEGSHAAYEIEERDGDAVSEATLRLLYEQDHWQGICDETDRRQSETRERRVHVPYRPPMGPPDTTPGDRSELPYYKAVDGCEPLPRPTEVRDQVDRETTQDGAPVTVQAWHGTETDAEAEGRSHDAWWEDREGLVIQWRVDIWIDIDGTMTDTDAPIG